MLTICRISSTVLIAKKGGCLIQRAQLSFHGSISSPVRLEASAGGATIVTYIQENIVSPIIIDVPAVENECELTVRAVGAAGDILSVYKTNWKPQRRWSVHFVPITHHDLGYTEPVEPLFDSYCRYYKQVMSYCEKTEDYPEDAKYHYTVEELWSLLEYLRRAADADKEQLITYIRQGRVEISALFANIIDGICSDEEIIRLLYAAAEMKRLYDIPVNTACLVDIPGMSAGVIEALCAADIPYLFAGFPRYFEWTDTRGTVPPLRHSFWDESKLLPHGRPQAFLWKARSGGEVLTWYQAGYGWFGNSENPCIETDSYEIVEEYLPRFLKELEDGGAPYNVMRYIDHGSDNQAPNPVICDIVRRWNETYLSPRLLVSTNTAFFRELELQDEDFPELTGELPHTDYTVLSLTAAKETADNAVNRQNIMAVESLCALSAYLTDKNAFSGGLKNAYQDIMLYDEHCFGMGLPFGSAHNYSFGSKRQYVDRAAYRIDQLQGAAWGKLIENLDCEKGHYVTVFNSNGREYTGLVRVRGAALPADGFELVDHDGKRIPVQAITADSYDLPRPDSASRYAVEVMGGGISLHAKEYWFIADGIPALGYKTYAVTEGGGPASRASEAPEIENEYYRIFADEKKRIHFVDKTNGRELGDTSGMFFGQLLCHNIVDGTVGHQTITSIHQGLSGPVAFSLVLRGNVTGCPEITQEITLIKGESRIEVSVGFLKNTAPFHEIFAVFPFVGKPSEFWYRGLLGAEKAFDGIPGANTHHYTMNGYAFVKTEGCGGYIVASPEAKIMEFGRLRPTAVSQAHHGIHPEGFEDPFDQDMGERAHFYTMLTYNNCRTNFSPAGGGQLLYRFAFDVLRGQTPEHFGARWLREPIAAGFERDRPAGGGLPKAFEFTRIDKGNIYLQCFKGAEHKKGFILRFRECEGVETDFMLELPAGFVRAAILNAIEEERQPLTLQNGRLPLKIAAHSVLTVHIMEESANHE